MNSYAELTEEMDIAPMERWTWHVSAIRALDIAVSATMLLFFLPLLIAVAAAIWVIDPGPVFFAHHRLGKGGKLFPCLKFRTMVIDADARLAEILRTDAMAQLEWQLERKLKNDPRVTWFGRFLRKTSIDELPQLVNVLRGDMSIVGPRPIVTSEAALYGRYFGCYCANRPGITGLWQISGRNDVTYRRRVAMDVLYSRRRSLHLNVKILAGTVPAVLMSRGSY